MANQFQTHVASGLVENAVQQAQSYRSPLRRVERRRESGDRPGKHVDAERQPRPCDKLTGLLVHDQDIHLRVIDLNQIERFPDLQPSRRRFHRLLRDFVVPQASFYQGINVVNAAPDGARIGRLLSLTSATRCNLAHKFAERRPFGNEVDLTNRRLNDRLNAIRDVARAYRPSRLSRQEQRRPPIFVEALDQPIETRDADPEFRCSLANSCSPDAARPLLRDQPPNFFFTAAGLSSHPAPSPPGYRARPSRCRPALTAHVRQPLHLCDATTKLSQIS
jgi:hypothetical protein